MLKLQGGTEPCTGDSNRDVQHDVARTQHVLLASKLDLPAGPEQGALLTCNMAT